MASAAERRTAAAERRGGDPADPRFGPSPEEYGPGIRRWDLYYAVTFAATEFYLLATADRVHLVSAAVLALCVPLYLAVGRPSITHRRTPHGSPAARGYIAALVALFVPAASLSQGAAIAMFAIVPQCFLMMQARRAVVAVLALNLVPLAAWLLRMPMTREEVVTAIAFTVVNVSFSIVFGVWIDRIIDQSIERKRLIEELEESRDQVARLSAAQGALQERERLAREIHDTLAQGFTSVVMLSQAVEGELESDPDGARRHIRLINETARESLAESRDLVAAMTPARLADDSLEGAVRRLAARLAEETGIRAVVRVSGEAARPAPAVEVVVLRSCQEALANVRKHAAARAVAIDLVHRADGLELAVADDGRGFDAASGAGAGYGLPGMRARAAEIGGTAEVRSAPGEGTTVRVRLRLPGAAEAGAEAEAGAGAAGAVPDARAAARTGAGVAGGGEAAR